MRKQKNIPPVKILMVAINGYGHYYLKTLIEEVSEEEAILAGVVDPEAEKSGYYSWIVEKQIPVYSTIEEYFKNSGKADLTVISSPPQYHVDQVIVALKNKSNVLVDKPIGVGPDAVKKMIKVAKRKKRWVEVGFQWSFSTAIQNLKTDILKGVYGFPMNYKAICLWPRDKTYYSRNSWAGKKCDDVGNLVLDSPANNACAHFLHNLLFLCGEDMISSGAPAGGSSYTGRAYEIENFDTVSFELLTLRGVEIFFYASHATEKERPPAFQLELTHGIVRFDSPEKGIIGLDELGNAKFYGKPDDDHQFKKLFHAIGRTANGGSAICPPEAALSHAICVDMMNCEGHTIKDFKVENIVDDGNRRYVKGLNEIFEEAYENGEMIKI